MSDPEKPKILSFTTGEPRTKPRKVIETVCAADIPRRAKDWLWKGHLLRGAQELLTGVPNLGKSQVQIGYIACVTAGLPWPDGSPGMKPANAIMMTAEDTLDQEVIPRLEAAGANLKRVHIIKTIRTDNEKRQFLLAEDLDELQREVNRIGDVALVTIDPITAYMGGKMDSHKATEVRSQLGPLKDFAERTNVAVSTITHPPKAAGPRAMDHFIGSQAFVAAGRIAHLCVAEMIKDEEDGSLKATGRKLFANVKNNAHTMMPTLAYRITETITGQDATGANVASPYVTWDKESVDITADQAVAASTVCKGKGPSTLKVRGWLAEMLSGGPVEASVIEREGAAAGFSLDQLKRAKKLLGIVSAGGGRSHAWVWAYADKVQGNLRADRGVSGILCAGPV